MDAPFFRESVTDAIRFWEPRRLLYNARPLAAAVARINTGIMFRDALLVPLARMCFLSDHRVSPDSPSPLFTAAFLGRHPARLRGPSHRRRHHQALCGG